VADAARTLAVAESIETQLAQVSKRGSLYG
jgi:hypothetical protein